MSHLLKNKRKIINWLEKYYITNYTLIEDTEYGYIVDVDGDVDISGKNLAKIEVKFNEINGSFYMNNNKLTSLEGAPKIVSGNFFCSHNKLTSLEGAPKMVSGDFVCYNNEL